MTLYFGVSVAGQALTVGIEISLTPPLIFTGDQNLDPDFPLDAKISAIRP